MLWDDETDLLVLGSGAGGLAAALTGRVLGLDVILCEKTGQFGGTTTTSGGAIWIVASTEAERDGFAGDTVDDGRRYLRHETGNFYREDLSDAFLTRGREAVDFLADHSAVTFDAISIPDYHADAPGGRAGGRTLVVRPFDGRKLGNKFALLRPPMRRLMVLGGMMFARDEVALLIRPFASLHAFRRTAGLVLRHARDRLRHARGTRLLAGNALVGRFLFSLYERDTDLRPDTRLIDLIVDRDHVVGATVEQDGRRLNIRARRGVVLATGGPAHDRAAREEFMRAFPHDLSIAFTGNTGDGWRAGRAAGGKVDSDIATPAVWTPASILRERDGALGVFPYGYLDRGKPGAIAINADGVRFCNEANSYQDVVVTLFDSARDKKTVTGHLIFDRDFVWKYGIGVVPPKARSLDRWIARGYLYRAGTIADLATTIGVPPAALEATVARHNGFAEAGRDADFGKGDSTFNRFNGDPSVSPNPCLAPIARGPFYALPIHPATLGMSIGLDTDGDARVKDEAGDPIPGLYACGNEAGSVMRGTCPAGGVTLGPAIVFGYLAARHAVARTAD